MPDKTIKQVTWARLETPFVEWARHSEEDDVLSDLFSRSGFPVQRRTLTVDAANLDDLCRHFLVFATDISYIKNRTRLENLREYVYRGGFLYVEACHNSNVTPSMEDFHKRQLRVFAGLFPTAQLRILTSKHPIFNSPYSVPDDRNVTDKESSPLEGATPAFYALYDDDRTIAFLGEKGIRCAWGQQPDRTKEKMCLSVNAFAFAYREAGNR